MICAASDASAIIGTRRGWGSEGKRPLCMAMAEVVYVCLAQAQA